MKIAFFDWDGTLSADGHTVSRENAEAIAAFRAAGNLAVLCTGRCLGYVPDVAFQIGFDGVIAASGATVLWRDTADTVRKNAPGDFAAKWLYRTRVPDDMVREFLEFYAELPQFCAMLEAEHTLYAMNPFPHMPVSPSVILSSADDFFHRFPHEHVSKFTVAAPSLPMPTMSQFENCLHIVRYPHPFMELCLPGETKSAGIGRVLSALHLPLAATVAFGDSANDVDMLQYVACGVAMGNAPPDVRAVADRIALPADQNGVAAVLREFF